MLGLGPRGRARVRARGSGSWPWLAVGLANAFADPDSTSSPSPAISWRNDRKHSMVIGLVVGLMVGPRDRARGRAHFRAHVRARVRVRIGLVVGLVLCGLAAGLVAGLGISHAWPTTLAAAQLARRWHTPLHLMNFLDDARERNVLRTVGPVYQFRHARLQDRLAATAVNGSNNGRTDQPLG